MPPAPRGFNIGHTDAWQLLATAGVLLGIDGVVLYSLRGRFLRALKEVEQGGSGNTGEELGNLEEKQRIINLSTPAGSGRSDNVIVDWWAAGAVYILHPLCLYWLVVLQGLHLGFAAVLGLHVYSSYELTNKATLRRWPRWLVAFDCVWGMTLYTVVVVVVRAAFSMEGGVVGGI